MNSLQDAYRKFSSPQKINPNDPMQVGKLRRQVESESGGRSSIKTVSEMEGSGLTPESIDPSGYGYTVIQTEREKQRYNPNSEAFRKEMEQARQRRIEEEMKRKGGFR